MNVQRSSKTGLAVWYTVRVRRLSIVIAAVVVVAVVAVAAVPPDAAAAAGGCFLPAGGWVH